MEKYKGVYIRNIEAVDIFKIRERGNKLYCNWTGYVPYSLELLKLKNEGMQILKRTKNGYLNKKFKDEDFLNGKNNKSLDMVNLTFRCGWIDEKSMKEDKDYIEINQKIELIRKEKKKGIREQNKKLKEIENKYKFSSDDLRVKLYEEGFIDDNGIKFVLFKRSSSKSRQGKVTFIREDLAEKMLNWGRMNLPFVADRKAKVVELGAYSSLVSSSIEDTIKINPESVLVINDIKSKWHQEAKKVIKDSVTGHLRVIREKNMELKSEATDGSGLLDKEYFEEGIDFKLLRNHMFKSCAFKCDIQLFFKDYCIKEGIDYDSFHIEDMFGNKMLAKNIKLIVTPNSLKAFKFSNIISTKKEKLKQDADMFKYWKRIIKKDKNIFGVVKHNKSSKWQFNNTSYQQMSYQMVGSLNLSQNDLIKITEWEVNYIMQLKNDLEVFRDYLILKANNFNVNKAFVDILNTNENFKNTKIFKSFKAKTINKYVDKIRGGKIKLQGDYATIIANPLCYLYQALGIYSEDMVELKGNEVYTKLFDNNKELAMFRNPHTSQANCYLGKNKYISDIDKYFNFSKNTVVVNAINNPICQILSGADFDSDNCVIYDNEIIVEKVKENYNNYLVVENGIDTENKDYILNNTNLAIVDNMLSKSKTTIGKVVNLGALALAKYWDRKNNGASKEELEELQEIVDIMTILSGCAIDNAKRVYDVDMDSEIKYIRDKLNVDKKPLYWRYVTQDKQFNKEEYRKENSRKYDASMDILSEVIDLKVKKANGNGELSLASILKTYNRDKANRKQMQVILESVTELDNLIKELFENKTKENEEELYREIDLKVDEVDTLLLKMNLKEETIYNILLLLDGEGHKSKCEKYKSVACRIINTLYRKNSEKLLNVFSEK